jgi:biopolymer transport protein ExbD
MRIRQSPSKRGRIEIVPMIDVVFFLLVFSMLGSLALASIDTPKVDVPSAVAGVTGAPTRVFVTLTRDRELYVNQLMVAPDGLTEALEAEIRKNPGVMVIVNCDRANSWGDFRALMAAAYKADPAAVAIMTKARTVTSAPAGS